MNEQNQVGIVCDKHERVRQRKNAYHAAGLDWRRCGLLAGSTSSDRLRYQRKEGRDDVPVEGELEQPLEGRPLGVELFDDIL